jgi:hypothetical protein
MTRAKRKLSTLERAIAVKSKLAEDLAALATERLELWRREHIKNQPNVHGMIMFGNGADAVHIDGLTQSADSRRVEMSALRKALEDVWAITGNYTLACPDDFKF